MAWSSRRGVRLRKALAIALSFAPICALLWPLCASAAEKAFVQARRAAITSGSDLLAAFAHPNGDGDLIVAYVVWDGGGSVALSDSQGNGYASAVGPTPAGAGGLQAQIFYARSAAGPNAVTAVFAQPVLAQGTLCIHEYRGVSRSAPLDAAAFSSGASSDVTSGALQTSASGELLFAAIASDGGSVKPATRGVHRRTQARGALTADSFSGDAGSYDVSALQSGSGWAAQLVAFGYSGGARSGPAYPLRTSANQRYLVDQRGKPFLITGDSPQSLLVNLSEREAARFFADRARAGFNTLWINLLCGTYTGGRSDLSTRDGIVPFQNGAFSNPNEAYFARVDRMIRMAASQGITVLLDPVETGFFLITTDLLLEAGVGTAHDFGVYLGTRYRSFDNIIWINGSDFQQYSDPAQDAVVQAVSQGIREADPGHLQTVELNFLLSGSLDDPTWRPLIDLNASYSYYPTYAEVLRDYDRADPLPTFLVEANYDFENEAGSVAQDQSSLLILRRQAYWSLTSGATGQMYGNGWTWPFLAGWQHRLDTPGSRQMSFVRRLFEPRRWFDLVPDQGHALVTAGFGTFADSCPDARVDCIGANDYVTAARTPDGALAIAYLPAGNTITVDLSQLAGPVTASWYDPSRGTLTGIAGSPLSNAETSHVFTPPGNNRAGDPDWVLVLDAAPAP